MPFFEGSRGRVHYRRWPVESPRAHVVFLHGRGQHSGHYHRFAAALAAHGIETTALDHIGHGLSEGDIGDDVAYLDALAENARLLVEQIGDRNDDTAGRIAVMGHSLGSATAVRMLADGSSRAVTALVLVALPTRLVDRATLVRAAAVPTLALHGVDDRMVPIDGVRDLVRGTAVTLREYDDAGHDLLHEKIHRVVTDDAAAFVA
ncbi:MULTISPECIES: alpha/beta hydrolase [Nocardiaceae]|uniref:Alpha/beta fold hydrolase n=1 Tax=Rhodococcoides kroppenstedtii TaxID=293050 RepID=A0ABS7NS88_9NOCA|nr:MULTISPECIES: alpha/beta fold hydrolase [Rhodococcus]MBY6313184.1 alpha/beta fold hydrolase [Rhodococcus kroppenstedtii]MBY6320871.1 alpha/beta fold hydrolase [Rhodococcus kroppenstedtii]MBY6399774.1 alpha/beta fold hydrolase [Rhodococcus kroppenstedtii]